MKLSYFGKVFGKIVSPTISCIDEREIRESCNKLLFQFVFFYERRKKQLQLHP